MIRQRPQSGLAGGMALSFAIHLGLLSFSVVLYQSGGSPKALPPMYKVELIAAPPGPPAIGEVTPDPTPAPTKPVDPPKALPKTDPDAVPIKSRKTADVFKKKPAVDKTPVPVKKSAPDVPLPKAGGGATGGTGADVANVRTEGIDFPFPGYLQNIVRQIALNFSPSDKSLRNAEVFFLVKRDGSVTGFRFLTRSGSYAFDLECQGAVEAAAAGKKFGTLPSGFLDDVLPVIFRFDPKILH